jgi:protein-histidine pros-kinase
LTNELDLVAAGLLEAAPDAIIGVNAEGIIVLANAQAERLFGYDRSELKGHSVDILVPDAVRGIHPQRRGGYVADPRPRPMGAGMELAGRRRDGSEFPAEISLSAIETDDGVIVSAFVRDVTDRKRAEAKFRGLLEAAPDAIVGVNADGTIVLANAQAERLFGYDRTELIGQTVDLLVPDNVRAIHPQRRGGYVQDPRPRPMGAGMELAGRRRDGSEFPAEISLSAIETEEGMIVSAAVRDVTDRKRIEQQLREKNVELEMANRAKDTFLASMSHELRTPLNAIIGFTGTLLMQLPGPLNDEQRRQLRTVQTSGKHLLAIINDLLDLAKIESGAVQLNLEAVDCNDVAQQTITSLQPLAADKGLELQIEAPEEPVLVKSDARALGQILINLVNNAIKFTDEGRVVVTLSPAHDGTPCQISVADTGRGIGESDLTKVFLAFNRGSHDNGSPQEGTGLGLHISQKLAELIDARISVTSELGQGSAFTVSIGD